jgi:phage terminase large subunit GpA-like protein
MADLADLAEIKRRAFAALVPPCQIPLSQWIEANIVLPTGLTAIAGPMRLYKPQREVADVLGNPEYTQVSVLKSARVGYTVLATAAIAYWAIQDPGPILILMPVESDAKDYMSTDLEPIFSGYQATAIPSRRGSEAPHKDSPSMAMAWALPSKDLMKS